MKKAITGPSVPGVGGTIAPPPPPNIGIYINPVSIEGGGAVCPQHITTYLPSSPLRFSKIPSALGPLSEKQNEFWPSEVCPSTDMPYTHGILFTTLLEKNKNEKHTCIPTIYLLSSDVLDHEMSIYRKKQLSIFMLNYHFLISGVLRRLSVPEHIF